MMRTPVSSSALASVGYDADSETLEIELTSGGVYRYFDVPEAVYIELLAAGSAGGFYVSRIKDRYEYARVV